jgi:hypothetical protein
VITITNDLSPSTLARAEQQWVKRKRRLTPHRRRVLEVVAADHRAVIAPVVEMAGICQSCAGENRDSRTC